MRLLRALGPVTFALAAAGALLPVTLDAQVRADSIAQRSPSSPAVRGRSERVLNIPQQVDDTIGHSAGANGAELDVLVRRAVAVNPLIQAAKRRLDAARARVVPASLPFDPMLMFGIQNLPLGRMPKTVSEHGIETRPEGPDEMTMRMIGVSQVIPYPGKLSLRRRAAEREVEASQASLSMATREVVRDVKEAYYELAFIDQALSIVERNQGVLVGFVKVTETRYSVGVSGQQDVLKARVEAIRLAESAVSLTEQRRAALARLNALLDRPTDTPAIHPAVPKVVARAAVPTSAREIRFTSAALGARAANSPLPLLAELQQTAVRESPEIREHEAMIAAQMVRIELARKEFLPDFDLTLQYGQRSGGLPDMLTALVSVPLPVFKKRKQDRLVLEAGAQLAALQAEHMAKVNQVRAEVARLSSEIERSRAQLALYVKALLPQARASLTSATASYQVGRVEFLTVLDAQATVFNYETEYFRALSDFATKLAVLEQLIGKEIL